MPRTVEFLVLVAYLFPLNYRTDFEVEFNIADTRWRPKPGKICHFRKNDETSNEFGIRGFLGSLMTNMTTDFENSKMATKYCACASEGTVYFRAIGLQPGTR